MEASQLQLQQFGGGGGVSWLIRIALLCLTLMVVFFQLERGVIYSRQQATVKKPPVPAALAWNANSLIFPLSLGLPEGRFGRAKKLLAHLSGEVEKQELDRYNMTKTRDFAPVIPGNKKTYTFTSEDSYYKSYATAYFGITMKKAGWDCLRHYEIIAAGSIPYFLNLAKVPHNTMHDFPFSMVQEAMKLPGVPFQEEVIEVIRDGSTEHLKIDKAIFNETRYHELLYKMMAHSIQHLTWKAKAQYMLSSIQKYYPCLTDPRILMITPPTCEYMSCAIFGGLYDRLGSSRMSSLFGPKYELFETLSPGDTNKMYGRGFSYSRVFSDPWNVTQMDALTKQRLKDGFFNMIVFTNGGNMYCDKGKYFYWEMSNVDILNNYQKQFNPLVVLVDGNDISGCHKFFSADEHPLEHHAHFIREFHNSRSQDQSLPVPWNGCNVTN